MSTAEAPLTQGWLPSKCRVPQHPVSPSLHLHLSGATSKHLSPWCSATRDQQLQACSNIPHCLCLTDVPSPNPTLRDTSRPVMENKKGMFAVCHVSKSVAWLQWLVSLATFQTFTGRNLESRNMCETIPKECKESG